MRSENGAKMEKSVDEIVRDIKQFAKDHKLEIHPGRDLQQWATLVIHEGYHCPCKTSREGCPCDETLEDIERDNCCCCRFFVNQAYLKEYRRLLGERRLRSIRAR